MCESKEYAIGAIIISLIIISILIVLMLTGGPYIEQQIGLVFIILLAVGIMCCSLWLALLCANKIDTHIHRTYPIAIITTNTGVVQSDQTQIGIPATVQLGTQIQII